MRSNLQSFFQRFVSSSFSSNVLIYGLLTTALLAIYFLCISLISPEFFVELRFGNLIILGAGISLAMRDYFQQTVNQHSNYLDGWLIGLMISMMAGLLLGLFMLVFLTDVRPDIGLLIHEQISFGKLPLAVLPLITLVEAVFSGMMLSFIGMQYFKNTNRVGHRF